MAKTVEEKKATRKAWLEKRREWIRNEFRQSIDNYDRERFEKTCHYVLDHDYFPMKEYRALYKEFIATWHDRILDEDPKLRQMTEDLKKSLKNA